MRMLAISIIRPSSDTAPLASFEACAIASTMRRAFVTSASGGRGRLVREGNLRGVDRPLALVAEYRRTMGGRLESIRIVEVAERAIDRAQPIGPASDHHARLGGIHGSVQK